MSSHRPNNGLIGPQECPPGQELVRTYYKKNGEMVRSYCRNKREDIGARQERQMIDTQERGIYEAETDYTGEKHRRGY